MWLYKFETINTSINDIFTECLLWAKHYLGLWGYSSEHNRQKPNKNPCLQWAYLFIFQFPEHATLLDRLRYLFPFLIGYHLIWNSSLWKYVLTTASGGKRFSAFFSVVSSVSKTVPIRHSNRYMWVKQIKESFFLVKLFFANRLCTTYYTYMHKGVN